MNDQSEEPTSTLPLIVGMLAAFTVGYWVFLGGGSADHPAAIAKPATMARR